MPVESAFTRFFAYVVLSMVRELGADNDMVDVGRRLRRRHWPGRIGLLLLGYSAQATTRHAVDAGVVGIGFHRLGRLRDRATEAQQYRASGLAIITAAIALWNTVYLGRALNDLRRGGEIIPDPLLAHLAPVGWQHINLTGDYLSTADPHLAPDEFRQLGAPAAITAHAA
jgi:Tn3 transposase DDE domain